MLIVDYHPEAIISNCIKDIIDCLKGVVLKYNKQRSKRLNIFRNMTSMTEETKPQTFAIAITTGTNNPLQTHLAVLNGFTQRKLGNNVCFILQGEAGSVANEEVLRTCNGFGLPPIAKFLDDECMKEVEWII